MKHDRTLRLKIDGMHCASCVSRVEAALTGVQGVDEARVDPITNTATVAASARGASAGALIKAVEGAGYAAEEDLAEQTSAERHRDRQDKLRARLIVAALLTAPLLVFEMGGHLFPPLHAWFHQTVGHLQWQVIQFLLATVVLAWPGAEFFRLGVPSLLDRRPDMNALVALGTFAAWAYSTVAIVAPGLFPEGARAVYFESAAVIVTFILAGRYLEERAKARATSAVDALLALRPDTAEVERNGSFVTTPAADLRPGDRVQVRPGGRIPADGAVHSGQSWADEAMMTGEPRPVEKEAGDPLTGGTINGTGTLLMTVEKAGADTTLANIIRLVEEAGAAKVPVQEAVDRVTAWFVPAVILAAALTAVVWLSLGPDTSFALVTAVSVLIVACPCAMGLATPASIVAGTRRAARQGIIFRRPDALERLAAARTVAFDKTGTLTMGRPVLETVHTSPEMTEDQVLGCAAAVEALSEHPLATAVVDAAKSRGLSLPEAAAFEASPGRGAVATVGGQTVHVGSERYLEAETIDTASLSAAAAQVFDAGQAAVYVAVDGKAAAVIGLADQIRPSAKAAVAALKNRGIEVTMITGDTARGARPVADALGISRVVAEVSPDGKYAAVEKLHRDGNTVAFVGDGINDAPALAAADIGIALGSGTDVALTSADVVLVSDDLGAVDGAVDAGRRTMRNIRQNLGWAFIYNVTLIPVAAGVLYPAYGVLLSPMLASAAMALSSVAVLANALRLLRMPQ